MICKFSDDKVHHMINDREPIRDIKGIHYLPDTIWFCKHCKKTSKEIKHEEEIKQMRYN